VKSSRRLVGLAKRDAAFGIVNIGGLGVGVFEPPAVTVVHMAIRSKWQ
jgi:hypothetical protein